MPTFKIEVVNADFHVTQDVDATSQEDARGKGLRGALDIGRDEICGGKPFFAAEITVHGDEVVPQRMMVAIGTSPLR